ncbi:MAG: antibiotic biosynthesis monooxygenase family protein [Actinomycetota bacterium]
MTKDIETYASGNWKVKDGSEGEFLQRWTEFLEWTKQAAPGLTSASLIRDAENPRHFVSFAEWKDEGSRKGWQSHEEFPAKLSRCRELCDEFVGGSYDLAARVS